MITEILPEFSRKPIFEYMGLVGATIAITGLSVAVWAHHMFATGAALLPFFAFMTYLIAVPTGVELFPVLPRRRHHQTGEVGDERAEVLCRMSKARRCTSMTIWVHGHARQA